MPEVVQAQVRAEPLESFVAAQAPRLQALLEEQERWARAQLPYYSPRPDALAFRAEAPEGAAPATVRFLQALRVNPQSRLPLFLQLRPGSSEQGTLAWERVTTLRSGAGAREHRFRALMSGEEVNALEVVASASAEPDYGLDLGLWDDNHGDAATGFGFGRQPFGNPAVDYSGQAPFHMGFYHEARIVFAAAGFLKRTYPEHRIQQFLSLARLAFATGHGYWGWRFTGWALHYVQDLTQPYHSRVLPGVGTLRMLAVNALDLVGASGPKNDAITLVTNRHTAVENYQLRRMVKAYERGDAADLLLSALRDASGDGAHRLYRHESTRQLVSAEADLAADGLDRQLERTFPSRYTSDPSQLIGQDADQQLDMHVLALKGLQSEHDELAKQLARLMTQLGRHSRALVRSALTAP